MLYNCTKLRAENELILRECPRFADDANIHICAMKVLSNLQEKSREVV